MAKERSGEKLKKRLKQQLTRFKDNPEKQRRITGRLNALKNVR